MFYKLCKNGYFLWTDGTYKLPTSGAFRKRVMLLGQSDRWWCGGRRAPIRIRDQGGNRNPRSSCADEAESIHSHLSQRRRKIGHPGLWWVMAKSNTSDRSVRPTRGSGEHR